MSGLPETGHDLQPADGRAERERHRRRAKMGVTRRSRGLSTQLCELEVPLPAFFD